MAKILDYIDKFGFLVYIVYVYNVYEIVKFKKRRLKMKQDFVTSADGTRIGYLTEGSGPAALVVPGALTTAPEFMVFSRELISNFTVHTMDRRGRNLSGPQGKAYSIAKECEDLRALQEKTGAEFIFGHSFGGFVTMEAARQNPYLKKIALYEPGISIDGSLPMGWAGECQKLLDQGKKLEAFIAFIRGLNPAMSGKMPKWLLKRILPLVIKPAELELKYQLLAGTIREHAEIARLDNTYPRYREISARVLLIYGGRPKSAKNEQIMHRLAGTFQAKRLEKFSKLDHFGPEKKPHEVAEAVTKFFLAE